MKSQNGWTLLELLLAVALLAVVAVIVYGSFRATVAAMERSESHGASAQQARVLLARMADELASADWSADREETLLIGASEEIDGRPAGRLLFTSRSHVWYPTQPLAIEQAVIGYTTERSSDELEAGVGRPPGLEVWREEEANPFSVASNAERLRVAQRLAGVQFRFYADGAWAEAWDASVSLRLPELIEVVLMFEGADGREEEYRTMIALPLRKP